MARRVARPPPAGMPKFKLEIPTDAPVVIEAEKVNANEVGTQPVMAEAQLAPSTTIDKKDSTDSDTPPPPMMSIAGNDIGGSISSSALVSGRSLKKAYIQFDETLVSPVVALGFHDGSSHRIGPSPTSSAVPLIPSASPTTGLGTAFPNNKKFYQVDRSNLYVFEEGAPLVTEDGNFASQQWNEIVGGASGEMNKGIAGSTMYPQSSDDIPSIRSPSLKPKDADSEASFSGMTPRERSMGTPSASQGSQPYSATKKSSRDRVIYLNQLELLEKVGAGQQGSVFKCKHKERGDIYALKKLSMSQLQDNPDPIERQARKASIVRELKMLTQCKHDCDELVALHNAYFQGEELMMLMEWMGTNVEDLLKLVARIPQEEVQLLARDVFKTGYGGDKSIKVRMKECGQESARMMEKARINRATALPEMVAAVITSDVLRGLKFLHEDLRIVHTDLKPANILLTPDNTMGKIADFGCSMKLGEDGKVRYKGVTLGTKLYMPPDRVNSLMMAGPEDEDGLLTTSATPSTFSAQKLTATIEAFKDTLADASSGSFDEKADIWSFGIVLLELINGCHPCQALARDNYWNYANDLRFPKMLKPTQMSDLLYDVLQKCLAVEPSKRPSAAEILNMPFYQKYKSVDRKKFSQFIDKIKKSAVSIEHDKKQRDLQQQIKALMTAATSSSYHSNQSKQVWAKHNGYLNRSGLDQNNFPSLPRI